eukprot:TRINITY_DN9460_c0_g1_i2.p1 TRINITY_DN9460_c0_g1~~TRINITY_DN9460_c0_g1_i2.p1  ORF type:complete len:132 (-),score=42.66 TRINITY_DN9460_c0_g1_i2:15-410(-)
MERCRNSFCKDTQYTDSDGDDHNDNLENLLPLNTAAAASAAGPAAFSAVDGMSSEATSADTETNATTDAGASMPPEAQQKQSDVGSVAVMSYDEIQELIRRATANMVLLEQTLSVADQMEKGVAKCEGGSS